jgi:hypothetical protein
MNCPKCGNVAAPGAAFCTICGSNFTAAPTPPMMGQPPPPMYPQQPMMMMPQRTSGMAIAGFVCAFFCSILGLIFSIMGHNEVKRSNGQVGGGGLAIAGIVISIIGIVFTVLYFILVAAMVSRHPGYRY